MKFSFKIKLKSKKLINIEKLQIELYHKHFINNEYEILFEIQIIY